MRVAEIHQFCEVDKAGESLVRAAMGQMGLSARDLPSRARAGAHDSGFGVGAAIKSEADDGVKECI